MPSQPILVLITAPDVETARTIAGALVEQKLAACVNIAPGIQSLFTWNGALNDEREVLLIAKSSLELFEARLVPAVLALHPYQVPEIIALPVIAGLPAYLDWMAESLN